MIRFRYMLMAYALFGMNGLDPEEDVLYTMLPMYHSTANGLCSGSCTLGGEIKRPFL